MAFSPNDKTPGNPLLSQDWNAHVHETIRLETAKVNRSGDTLTGDLTIAGALKAAGNVGVGTANPQARLTVQQGPTDAAATAANRPLFVSGTLPTGRDGSGGGIEFRHDNLTQGIGFGFNTIYATGSLPNQELALQSRGASPLLLNPNSGNVGIGTNAPQSLLHVNGEVQAVGTFRLDGSDRAMLVRQYDPFTSGNKNGLGRWGLFMEPATLFLGVAGSDYGSYSSVRLGGWRADSTREDWMTINKSGNVGIGTTNPQFPLQFANVLGDKIGLWGDYATNHYGLGVQANTLQIHGDAVSTRVAFGWGGSASFHETMRIQGDGTLVVQGAITPSWGNSAQKGIMFPADPGAGGGDTAYIRYYPRATPGEACSLEIGITNDADDHIQLMPGGGVGISCIPDPNYKMHINGTVLAGRIDKISDARYKKNIHTLSNALETVRRLRGVRFDWNQEAHSTLNLQNTIEIGMIAQEVEEVLPEIVTTSQAGYRALSYESLIPLLIEAIKEQQAQIDAMAARSTGH